MKGNIGTAGQDDYDALNNVWEDSVGAAHDFLSEGDIFRFKPLIIKGYFDAVPLTCCGNPSEKIAGFLGVAKDNVEIVFVASAYRE